LNQVPGVVAQPYFDGWGRGHDYKLMVHALAHSS
jgi:hypothetical protein